MNNKKYISQMFTDLKITDIVQTVIVVLSFIIAWVTLQDWKNEKKFEIQTTLRSSVHNDFMTFSSLHYFPNSVSDIDSIIIHKYNSSLNHNEDFYRTYPKVKPFLLRKIYYDFHVELKREEYKNLIYNANLTNQLDESDGCPLTLKFYEVMYKHDILASNRNKLLDLEMVNFKLKNKQAMSQDSLYNLLTSGLNLKKNNTEISELSKTLMRIINKECI